MPGAQRFSVDPNEFAGKRVVVTGGTKGMGEAIARRLAAAGAMVATTARSPLPDGQAPALFVQADLGTASGVEKVVGEVLDGMDGVDILVNNLGGSSEGHPCEHGRSRLHRDDGGTRSDRPPRRTGGD